MDTDQNSFEVIAHRGFSARAPENTLAAVEAALVAGADAVEWDVQVASCGTPVLFHDPHLGRTTNGAGPLRRRSFGELRGLDAGSWFSPDFAGERVPSLAEALERVRGRVGRVYTEVKGYRELEDVDRMVAVTRESGLLQTTVFISLDWRSLERIAAREAEARLGYIVEDVRRFEDGLERARGRPGTILAFDHRLVLAEPGLAVRSRGEGVEVSVWTVNDPEEIAPLLRAGVRRLTTDEVATFVARRARATA